LFADLLGLRSPKTNFFFQDAREPAGRGAKNSDETLVQRQKKAKEQRDKKKRLLTREQNDRVMAKKILIRTIF